MLERLFLIGIGVLLGTFATASDCHAQALFPPQNPWTQPPSQVVNISDQTGKPLGTATTYGDTTYYTNAACKPLGYTQAAPNPYPSTQPYIYQPQGRPGR